MAGAVGGVRGRVPHRCRAVVPALAVAALLLTGCPSPDPDAEPDADRTTERSAPPPDRAPPAPVTAAPDGRQRSIAPVVTVDLGPRGEPTDATVLDVVGTRHGGAAVLLTEPEPGPALRLVTVSADGQRIGAVSIPGLATAWNVHLLPGGAAVVTGRLAEQDALGYAVVDLTTGAVRTATAAELEPGTSRVAGDSAVSPDGRTVWLYSTALVDGRFRYRLAGHDLATGVVVASRDLARDLRAVHVLDQELDVVGLATTPGGGPALAVNAFPPEGAPLSRPMLLLHDTALEPLTGPLPLAAPETAVTARALAVAADGTAFVVLRGSPDSTLVAVPPGGREPERRVVMSGFGFTDELVLDSRGRAVLPGEAGARVVDLSTGATVDVDLGCADDVSVREMATSAAGGLWVLGGCFEDGILRPMLWRIP